MPDNNVYIKDGKKYRPFGLRYTERYLPDGIWYVHHTDGCHGTTNVDRYLAGLYRVGEASYVDIKNICDMEATSNYIMGHEEFRELLNQPHSIADEVRTIVKILAQRNEQ